VPQETHLAFEYSVMEMVLMGRHPHLGVFEVEGPSDLTVAREALAAVGAAALEDRDFGSLSGGEKQRVVIAAALAQSADVLLLDEPTASLDLGAQLDIGQVLVDLNRDRGVTIVVSTHDLALAARLCERLVLLRRGRVLAEGGVDEVLTPAHIRALYDVDAEVMIHAASGRRAVIPVGRSS
jgi:iron complex transport system ATP-binding protein